MLFSPVGTQKQNNPSNRLSSWEPRKDCCQWKGVECNTATGHVISLNLHCANSLEKLQGELRPSLLKLPYLSSLNLSGSDFMQSGVPAFLGNLGNLSLLESLDLSGNDLSVDNLKWLHGISSLKILDLSGADLSSCANDWFHDISALPYLVTLHLSCCRLHKLPTSLPEVKFDSLITLEYLSINYFNNSIPDWLFENCHHLQLLNLSSSHLQGPIPDSIERLTTLATLDLSHNELIGSIPDSIDRLISLVVLDLPYNNLSEKIPDTMKDCQVLTLLDLGSNRFWGPIPYWIGTEMQILKALILRGNSFGENIPTSLCQLKSLQILDLAENQLTGAIPRCVFPAMATEESIYEKSYVEFQTIKGSLSIYRSKMIGTRRLLKLIDLSSNFLTQGIPVEIAELVELIALNLSKNQLVGSIPSDIGEMENLEYLDLSWNQLSCDIPTSMVNLNFLSYLNLSYNTLSGKIPTGTQLQSFTNDSFEGNPRLCGPPLTVTETCPGNSSFKDTHCRDSEERNREHENDGNREDNGTGLGIYPLYISIAMGFFTGFWVFLGSLFLIASWRYAYFRFLDNMTDRIYVTVAVAHAKLQRKLQNQQPSL